MKPTEGNFASNALKHGVAGLNIDGTRVGTSESLNGGAYAKSGRRLSMAGDERDGAALGMFQPGKTADVEYEQPQGRWPANVVHDGSDEVVGLFPQTTVCGGQKVTTHDKGMFGIGQPGRVYNEDDGDNRSAARFFQTCRVDDDDVER